jgi:hypothetical protein
MQAIKCDSLNITYDIHGVATITMQVFSTSSKLDVASLPTEFGGISFTLLGINFTIKQVDNSGIYQFNVVLTGIGEK